MPVCMGVGGLFDLLGGQREPLAALAAPAGPRMAWRLFQEPRRMARRYLIGNPLFLGRVFCASDAVSSHPKIAIRGILRFPSPNLLDIRQLR